MWSLPAGGSTAPGDPTVAVTWSSVMPALMVLNSWSVIVDALGAAVVPVGGAATLVGRAASGRGEEPGWVAWVEVPQPAATTPTASAAAAKRARLRFIAGLRHVSAGPWSMSTRRERLRRGRGVARGGAPTRVGV